MLDFSTIVVFFSQAALQAVDSLDFETLSRRENVDDDDDDDDDVNESVEFNEEEVLKRCQGEWIKIEFT